VQEISKAEILVAYRKVDQAVSMLRDVLKKLPDNLDVHIKLKDVYLRTEMMAEAAEECRQLERIYKTRGEDERARDYAVRASRLTQLIAQPPGDVHQAKPRPAERTELRADPAPSRHHNTPNIPVVTSRLDATQVQPKQVKSPVITSSAPPSQPPPKLAESPQHVAPPKLAKSPQQVAPPKPAESPQHAAPLDLVCQEEPSSLFAEVKHDAMLSLVPALGETSLQLTDSSESALPVLFAASSPVVRRRGRFSAAAIAAGVFALLTAGTVIGGFSYNAHLDKQFEALALSATAPEFPSPPSTLLSEASQPVPEEESMTVVVTPSPQPDETPRTQKPEREVVVNERPTPLQPVSEPPRIAMRPSPTPPRIAVGSDSHAGTENRTPVGVPTGVPNAVTIDPVRPAEPPPKTVRQAAVVVRGVAVKRVEPVYPAAAKAARLTGVVNVEVSINEQGIVTASRALSGPPLLQNAAVLAARGWRFSPTTQGGVPVRTSTVIAFNFKL
jgi:protein TonB